MNTEELEPFIRSQVLQWLDHQPACTDEALWEAIEEEVFRQSRGLALNSEQTARLVSRIYHSFRGLDALQPLLDDPAITEIMINGYDELFIERRGVISRYDGRFSSPEKLEDVIQAVVAKVNRVVNASTPIVDARLPDGSRVNVVLPPVALKGPAMTIRKFPERPLTMADLVRMGAINPAAVDFLRQLVLGKYNVFISGLWLVAAM